MKAKMELKCPSCQKGVIIVSVQTENGNGEVTVYIPKGSIFFCRDCGRESYVPDLVEFRYGLVKL